MGGGGQSAERIQLIIDKDMSKIMEVTRKHLVGVGGGSQQKE